MILQINFFGIYFKKIVKVYLNHVPVCLVILTWPSVLYLIYKYKSATDFFIRNLFQRVFSYYFDLWPCFQISNVESYLLLELGLFLMLILTPKKYTYPNANVEKDVIIEFEWNIYISEILLRACLDEDSNRNDLLHSSYSWLIFPVKWLNVRHILPFIWILLIEWLKLKMF